ncbi:hypothetical protein HDU96_003443, partial [Phlyctochytrium bullatum]
MERSSVAARLAAVVASNEHLKAPEDRRQSVAHADFTNVIAESSDSQPELPSSSESLANSAEIGLSSESLNSLKKHSRHEVIVPPSR